MTNHVNTYAVVDRQADNLEWYQNRKLHRSFEYKSYVWGWSLRFAFGLGMSGFAMFFVIAGFNVLKNPQAVNVRWLIALSFLAGIAAFGLALAYGLHNRVNQFDAMMEKQFEEMEFKQPEPQERPSELISTNHGQGVMVKTRRGKVEEFAGHEFTFTGRNLDKLLAWYEGGAVSIRRDQSAAGPGFNRLPDPIVAANFTTALFVLKGRGMIDESTNEWTDAGISWLTEE